MVPQSSNHTSQASVPVNSAAFQPIFNPLNPDSFMVTDKAGNKLEVFTELTPKIQELWNEWYPPIGNYKPRYNCFDLIRKLAGTYDAHLVLQSASATRPLPELEQIVDVTSSSFRPAAMSVFQICGMQDLKSSGYESNGPVHTGLILGWLNDEILVLEKQGNGDLTITTLRHSIAYHRQELTGEPTIRIGTLDDLNNQGKYNEQPSLDFD